jgi:hypothetical protein
LPGREKSRVTLIGVFLREYVEEAEFKAANDVLVVDLFERRAVVHRDHGLDGLHDHVHDRSAESDLADRLRVPHLPKADYELPGQNSERVLALLAATSPLLKRTEPSAPRR